MVDWEVRKLAEVGNIFSGNSINAKIKKEKYTNLSSGIPYIATKDVSYDFIINYDNGISIPKNELSNFRVASENSIFICAEGGSAGRKLAFNTKEVCFVNKLFALEPFEFMEPKFIYYFYQTTVFKKQFMSKMTGLIGGVSMGKFKNIDIPTPPRPEQLHIVAILDSAFENIARAKKSAEQNLKNTNEIFESYLQSVFENKGEGWEDKRLDDVADTWGRIGWKGLTAKEYTSEGALFLSVHSLNYGVYVDFRDAFHISQERYDESPEIMLRKDDILICKDGAGIGKLGIVPELPAITTINSSLLLIRCKKNVMTKYLYYNLFSPLFQNIVKSRLMGATTPHLYQRDIVTFPILLPSLSNQQSIVAKLDALSAETKKLEAIYTQKLADLEELKKSILQKAFNGELK